MAGSCPPLLPSPLTQRVLSALQGARRQAEAAVSFPDLLLVSGLDQTEHHFCQCHPPSCPPPCASVCGCLIANCADEVGADLPLALTHLQQQQQQ